MPHRSDILTVSTTIIHGNFWTFFHPDILTASTTIHPLHFSPKQHTDHTPRQGKLHLLERSRQQSSETEGGELMAAKVQVNEDGRIRWRRGWRRLRTAGPRGGAARSSWRVE